MSDTGNPDTSVSLRIIFVAPFGLRQKTTVWARTLPMAQQLNAAGHHASILIPPWDSPEDAGKVEHMGGVRLEHVSLAGGLLPTIRRMVKIINSTAPDIVHIVKPRAHAGLVQWWLWQRYKTKSHHAKLVLDVDDWEQAWNPINRYGWLTERFLAWQENWGLRHADGITAASRWLVNKVAEVAPTMPTLYIPNGVEPLTEAPPPAQPPDTPQILYFTRFVEVSPAWLRDFWQEMVHLVPQAHLVVAGTPVQPWLATPFHTELGALPQVQWLGYVPTEQLRELYARATCAIFPATPVPLQQAKCSVRLANTLLHGLPVVASAVGEQTSYGAEGAATLVPPSATPQAFAHFVADTLRHTQHPSPRSDTRSTATTHLLTRYSWSRLVQPLPDFYVRLKPIGQTISTAR